MRLVKFALTGGPCSGKTTAISMLTQVLSKIGYKVIIVPEAATELINAGICPWEVSVDTFQSAVLDKEISNDSIVTNVAKNMKHDVVIIYDRGYLDATAYMPVEDFKKLLRSRDMNIEKAMNNYNAVFDLQTAAIGAEKFYTLSNNNARTESLEEAIELDQKTRDAWIGHPYLRVIDNSTGFDEKMERLRHEVYQVLEKPVPLDIERKFIVSIPNLKKAKRYCKIVKINILQAYLHSDDPFVEKRIRRRETGDSFSYFYNEKRTISNEVRQMTGRMISHKEFYSLLQNTEKSLSKDRYCFLYKNQYFELDVYPNCADRAILEIKLTEKGQGVEIPKWIEPIKEVTQDPRYKNFNLAR